MLRGVDLFRAYNLARYAQGLPLSTAVPAHSTKNEGDAITVTGGPPYLATWTRTGPALFPSYTAIVYQVAGSTIPKTLDSTRKMRMLGSQSIEVGVAITIDSLLASSGKFWPGCVINLGMAIAESGDCPFCLVYCSFRFAGL